MRAGSVVFFAYIGFDAVSTAAQEARNPQKDMPFGILGSLIICTVLYIIVAGLLTGIKALRDAEYARPRSPTAQPPSAPPGASCLIDLGAIAGLASVMLVMILGQTRVLYTMSHDGLLPNGSAPSIRVSERHGCHHCRWLPRRLPRRLLPHHFPRQTGQPRHAARLHHRLPGRLGHARKQQPDVPRPFRTPWVPLVPILGMIISLALMVSSDTPAKIGFFSWLIIGLVIYFGYSIRHSKVQRLPAEVPQPK